MSNENKSSVGNYSVWIVLIGVAVTSLLGYSFFRANSALREMNDSESRSSTEAVEEKLQSQLDSLDTNSRLHADNYLQLIHTYGEIADSATNLGDSQAATSEVLDGIANAAELNYQASRLPGISEDQLRSLDSFVQSCLEEKLRMHRELTFASPRLAGEERQQIRTATVQLSIEERTTSTARPSSAYIN